MVPPAPCDRPGGVAEYLAWTRVGVVGGWTAAGPGYAPQRTGFWLPRSDQLDDMLEAAGVTDVLIKRVESNGWYRCYPNPTAGEFPFGPAGLMTGGQAREEAKLRLWCVVTGRAVPA